MEIFGSWQGIGRILLFSFCAYLLLIVFLRVSGKRTLTQMNAFDFVITIALGSTLSSAIINKDVPLVEGVMALAALIVLQFIVTWLCVRYKSIDHLVKAEPVKLVDHGVMLKEAMRRARVSEDEIWAALRQAHWDRLEDVKAVVLETNGKLSVVYAFERGNSLLE